MLYLFFGLLISMGLLRLALHNFFRHDGKLLPIEGLPATQAGMSKFRFEEVKRYFHIIPPSEGSVDNSAGE
jgi:hypothetical protein